MLQFENTVLFGPSDGIFVVQASYSSLFFLFCHLCPSLCSFVWHLPLCLFSFTLYSSCLKVILSRRISRVPPHLSTAFPILSSPLSLLPGGLPFVIDPCPGCLGIDWLSPCHWSSLSILTRFGHPLRCGQRVGERGRYTRCSTAPADKIKMNERESKTKRGGGENDGGSHCAKQLVSNLMRLLHFGRACSVFGTWSFAVDELMNSECTTTISCLRFRQPSHIILYF